MQFLINSVIVRSYNVRHLLQECKRRVMCSLNLQILNVTTFTRMLRIAGGLSSGVQRRRGKERCPQPSKGGGGGSNQKGKYDSVFEIYIQFKKCLLWCICVYLFTISVLALIFESLKRTIKELGPGITKPLYATGPDQSRHQKGSKIRTSHQSSGASAHQKAPAKGHWLLSVRLVGKYVNMIVCK